MNNTYMASGQTDTSQESITHGGEAPRGEEARALINLIPVQIYFCEGEIFYFAGSGNGGA